MSATPKPGDRSDPGNRKRATRVVLIFGGLLLVLAVTGVLRVDRGISVEKEQAVSIAQTQIDFQPERTAVRLVRQGFGSTPFWAVSFSVEGSDGGFERLTTVLVDARNGRVADVNVQR